MGEYKKVGQVLDIMDAPPILKFNSSPNSRINSTLIDIDLKVPDRRKDNNNYKERNNNNLFSPTKLSTPLLSRPSPLVKREEERGSLSTSG